MRRWIREVSRLWHTARGPARRRTCRLGVESLEERSLLSANFLQTNLVSNIQGMAATTDPNLLNPWGLTASATSAFWVSDNNSGVSTLYNGQGQIVPLVVNIPPTGTAAGKLGTPTGTVANPVSGAFQVSKGGKSANTFFLFDTLNGTIDGWAPSLDRNNAEVAVTTPGAVYTGLTLDATPGQAPLLYAANWSGNSVDVFDQNFNPVDKGAFQDPKVPSDFHPFNVQDIGGLIYVSYAKFDPTTGVDAAGPGNGFVDVFDRNGVLQNHLVSHDHLSSPWGLAIAPAGFGDFGGDLLVGNFGDGTIHAYDPHNGNFLGTVRDAAGKPITIENLWALRFGNNAGAGSASTLFFTAGLVDAPATPFGASAGLFGSLQAIPTTSPRASIVPNLAQAPEQTFSTVPANGDLNPYGVAFVPEGFRSGSGPLQPGDILVSNFNNAQNAAGTGNLQGTGTTIVRITPDGQRSVFFTSTAPGLGTALGVLRSGFVVVGNVPTSDGTAKTIKAGSLQILNAEGQVVLTLQDSKLLNGPWDLAVNDQGHRAQLFVANVLSGTVTRIDLRIEHGKVKVTSKTQIASGYKHEPNSAALVLGPTGLAYDPRTGTLFVASTDDNAIFAVAHAGRTDSDHGKGTVVFADQAHLHGPVGLVLAPNGDLIAANGDGVNADPTQPSELVEFTPKGQFVGQFSVDPGTDGAFGLATTDAGGVLRVAAVNDNTNALNVWTFETTDLDR
jgi:uncharacterized protein (TIGR03118 family)